MPLHSDFEKVRKSMLDKYGKTKGTEVFWSWLNKHGYDETKPLSNQKSKTNADGNALLDFFEPDENPVPVKATSPMDGGEKAISDGMNRMQADNLDGPGADPLDDPDPREQDLNDDLQERDDSITEDVTDDTTGDGGWESAAKSALFSVPAFRFPYVAALKPGFEGKDGPIIIKSLVLEEGHNINNWRVVPQEFESVAAQYKAGRHLRVNHGKDVQDVIGKSFEGKVIKGADVEGYLGTAIQGIDPKGLYVAAEFEANPQDPQVRTNILNGYVETGSIGLDANAFCEECDSPLKKVDDDMQRTCRHLDSPVKLKNVEVKEYSYVAEPAFEHTQAFPSFSAAVSSIVRPESSLRKNSPSKEGMSTVSSRVPVQAAKKAEAEGEGVKVGPESPGNLAEAVKLVGEIYKKAYAEAAKFRAEPEPDDDNKSPPLVNQQDRDPRSSPDAEAEASADAEGEGESEGEAEAEAGQPFPTGQKMQNTAPSNKGGSPIRTKVPNPDSTHKLEGARRRTDQIGKVSTKATSVVAKDDMMERVLNPTRYAFQSEPWLKDIFLAAANARGAPFEARRKIMEVLK